jgi:hypothetical protein
MNATRLSFFACLLCVQPLAVMATEIMAYEGTCRNITASADGNVKLMISEENNRLMGMMSVSGWLMGGGPVNGSRNGAEFKFTSTDPSGMVIQWQGELQNRKLSGEYVLEAQAGLPRQVGEWSADLKGRLKPDDPLNANMVENLSTAMLKMEFERMLNAPVKQTGGKYISGAQNVFQAVHPAGQGISIWVESVAVEWKTGKPKNLNGIHKLSVNYTLYWQGVLTPTGWTKIRLVYNANIDAVTTHEIIESTGATNKDADDLAFGIGVILGKAAMEKMLGPR